MLGRFVAVLMIVGVGSPLAWAAPLDRAEADLAAGKYTEAEAAFGKRLKGKVRGPALVGIARARLATDRLAGALRAAAKVNKGRAWADARLVEARAFRRQGKLDRATAAVARVLAKKKNAYRALMLLAELHREQGQLAEAQKIFDRFYDDYDADLLDRDSAEQLTLVARACRYTDNFRDAADTLADATRADPKYIEAHLELGDISLEKYEAGHAEAHYKRALAINPNSVRALVGMARVVTVQSNDVKKARKLLARARQVAPTNIGAAVLSAEILIDEERNNEAEQILVKALDRNPRHLVALSVLAASFYLRDDPGSFARTQAKVLGYNPKFTQFFRIVVRHAVRHHRYEEAIGLSKKAVAIDPHDWTSLADLGTNYLRMGEEKKGLDALRRAWKGDRFNVRTFNLLNLFEDVVARQYTFVSSKNFRLRVHKDEKDVLARTVLPLLERAHAIYRKKYKFTPKGPIVVELFRDRKQYAVRTVGLPGLGALGVCFGKVITAISPTNGQFNWGQVLWHELNHVFTIQLSRSRVPRWLTEGLADMEPVLERPEWKRERGFETYQALRAGKLHDVARMNTAFTQARSMHDMELAYYQGSLLARFLVDNFGLDKVVAGLKAFGRGKRPSQVLPAITGLSLAELNRRFVAEQSRLLARYATSWYLDPDQFRDLGRFRKQARTKSGDPGAEAELALSLSVNGKLGEAQKLAAAVLAKDPKNRLALFVVARAQLAGGTKKEARATLSKLIKVGGDGFLVRTMLGKLALSRNDLSEAERHLAAARRFDPEQVTPVRLLVQAYREAGKTGPLIDQLKTLVQLDQHSFTAAAALVQLLAERKRWAEVRRFGAMAIYIQPASAEVHSLLARAYAAPAPRIDLERAGRHLRTAIACQPKKPADLHARLADVLHQRGQDKQAKEELAKALRLDPENDNALKLKKKIR